MNFLSWTFDVSRVTPDSSIPRTVLDVPVTAKIVWRESSVKVGSAAWSRLWEIDVYVRFPVPSVTIALPGSCELILLMRLSYSSSFTLSNHSVNEFL